MRQGMIWGAALATMGMAASASAQFSWDVQAPKTYWLVNFETATLPAVGEYVIVLDGRPFGGDEDLFYFNVAADYGLSEEFAIGVRGGFASEETRTGPGASVRTGGTDIEIKGKYAPASIPGLAVGLGLSFPSTAAQDDPMATYYVGYTVPTDDPMFEWTLASRGVFIEDNELINLGTGVVVGLAGGFSVIADASFVIGGDNSINLNNGTSNRQAIFGGGLRYATDDGVYELGWTNGLGLSTGLGTSAGLQESSSLYLRAGFKF